MVRILLVDDEPDILEVIECYVEEFADEIYTANNGIEALKIIDNTRISLIISDMSMPEMDGLELLRQLKERGVMAPFIIVTGFGDKETVSRAWRLGAYEFLDKPISAEQLQSVVKSALLMGYDYNQAKQSETNQILENLKTVSLSIDESLYKKVTEQCETSKISVNTLILEAIKGHLN